MGTLALTGGAPVRTRPFPSWPQVTAADERAVARAVRSQRWGIGGESTAAFEKAFAACVGARYGVACANGTAALMVALLAGGIEDGAEVITPAYTFIATPMAALWCNATPVFADVDAETFNLDPAAAEAAVTRRTAAVIPVHFAGVAADMRRFTALGRRRGLTIIEDACHAHAAEYRGRRCGSMGDLAAFSFQSSKNLCCGEGGFVSTNRPRLRDLARAFLHIGRLPKSGWYEHAVPGGNFRLSNMQAALLLSQMRRLEAQTARRDRNGAFLTRALAAVEGIVPQKRGPDITRSSHHLFMFRVDPRLIPLPRDLFIKALNAEGVPCSAGYSMPLYRQKVFVNKDFAPFAADARRRRDVNYAKCRLPNTERLCAEVVWLYQSVLLGSLADIRDIVRAVKKVRDHYRELV